MPDMLTILIIVSLFAGAWVVSRAAAFVARRILVWQDRRNEAAAATIGAKINEIKRRETTVAMIRAAIAYGAFAVAAVFSVAQLTGGVGHLGTIAGASFVLILVGFSIQRVLMDVIAGLMMFIEGWYHVGDTIAIPMVEFEGVVEDVSLRRTKLRTVDGETIHVNNSQIPGVRAALLKERADPGLIVHGPVVLTLDEQAERSFARASAATRWSARPAPAP